MLVRNLNRVFLDEIAEKTKGVPVNKVQNNKFLRVWNLLETWRWPNRGIARLGKHCEQLVCVSRSPFCVWFLVDLDQSVKVSLGRIRRDLVLDGFQFFGHFQLLFDRHRVETRQDKLLANAALYNTNKTG
jgi:hypothetical protein